MLSKSLHKTAILAGLLLVFCASVPGALAGIDRAKLTMIDDTMRSYTEQGQVAGSVVLIKQGGNEVLHKAYGLRDRESADPMRPDTLFRIASMSKAIISVAVLQLQERGKLLIGDPVGKYLPEYQQTSVAVADLQTEDPTDYSVVAASRPINIRDLLTHTAGIGYGNGLAQAQWAAAEIQGWYFANRNEPIRETVRRIAALPMDAHPGERFVYGYNTDILGALVEVVSGQSLDEYVSDHIFTPLEMNDTHFYLSAAERDRLAVVYAAQEDGTLSRSPDTSDMNGQGEYASGPSVSFSGGAGLLSTATDYGRFLQAMLNGGKLGKKRILSPNTVRLMTVNHLAGIEFQPGMGFGLGFSVSLDLGARGIPGSVGEFAWGGAYHTVYWVDPVEDLVVVYMTQLLPARGLDDAQKLRALIYQAVN